MDLDLNDLQKAAITAAHLLALGIAKGGAVELGKAGVQRLLELVKPQLADDEGQAALTLVSADPANDSRISLLADLLVARGRSDAEFAKGLVQLVAELQPQAATTTVTATKSGITAGGSVDIRSLFVTGRDRGHRS